MLGCTLPIYFLPLHAHVRSRRAASEVHAPAPKHYVSVNALSSFLRRHGIGTAPGEHPVVHRFLQTIKLRSEDTGIVCIRDFLKDGAIAGVVARALLATLVVPSVEEFADSINSMLAHAMVSCPCPASLDLDYFTIFANARVFITLPPRPAMLLVRWHDDQVGLPCRWRVSNSILGLCRLQYDGAQ